MSNNVSERLMAAITKSELSYVDLEKLSGVPKSAINRYASGATDKIPIDRLVLIAKALNVDPAYLMGWQDATVTKKKSKGVRIPVLGRVAAGVPIEAIEEIIDYEEISQKMAATGDFFGLRIQGQSMEPKISEGDVVIVRKQDDCDTGDVAVVMINNCDATVKRIKKVDNSLMLVATNPAYDPMLFSPAEVKKLPVKIIGKVVELRAKF